MTNSVLSRTLFVGGVSRNTTEEQLRGLFSRYGGVQSIILTPEKRCAFVKMYSRDGAVKAREGMEVCPLEDTTLRVPAPKIHRSLRPNTVWDSVQGIAPTMLPVCQ
jgi:RNA recognition motif-containing protein